MGKGALINRLMRSIGFSDASRVVLDIISEDGGPGSGNFGHKGRPGKVGGSGSGGGKQYRGGRSDIGYFGSRKDWLNGLSGERQHKAARFLAEQKKTLNGFIAAREKIEDLGNRGLLTSEEVDKRLKEARLDDINENTTPEEMVMKRGFSGEKEELLNMMAEARSWPETAKKLMDENLDDNDRKLVKELAKKYGIDPAGEPFAMIPDDKEMFGKWEPDDQQCWMDLKSKAMGGPTSGKEPPDELQYAAGTKERPEPPKPAGPDYSWYEHHAQSFSGTNMEYYMATAAGQRVSYAEKWDEQKFAKVNQDFVDTLQYGKMSPNQLSYYGVYSVAAMRSEAMGGNFNWNPSNKIPKEMADRLSNEEKAQMINLMNAFDRDSFFAKYENFDDLTMEDFRIIESMIKHSTPRSKEAQKPIRDYLLLQEKMITGCVPKSAEERSREAEQARAEQAQQASQAEQQRQAQLNTPEAQEQRARAAELRRARENGESGSRPESVLAKSMAPGMYDSCTAIMDQSGDIDAQVAWDIYSPDVKANETTGGSFYRTTTGEIHLNSQRIKDGDSIHKPYQTAFHEVGHAIDHAAGKKFGYGDKHLSEVWRNGLFCDTIEKEAKAFVDKIGEEGRAQFEILKDNTDERYKFMDMFYVRGSGDYWEIGQGRKIPKWTIGTKRRYVASWLNKQEKISIGGLSDAIQGATRSLVNPDVGHRVSYYKGNDARENMATEFFANMYCTMLANKGEYETMKQHFPESTKLFHEMLKDISERG